VADSTPHRVGMLAEPLQPTVQNKHNDINNFRKFLSWLKPWVSFAAGV